MKEKRVLNREACGIFVIVVLFLSFSYVWCKEVEPLYIPGPVALATSPTNQGNAIPVTQRILRYWDTLHIKRTGLTLSRCTKANVLKYLNEEFTPPDEELVYWNNISHGDAYGLYFYDGKMYYYEFRNKPGIRDAVVFINSCHSFQDPLKSSMISNHPHVYIGGIAGLPQYTSENACGDFWKYYIIDGMLPSQAFEKAMQDYGLEGYFGMYEEN